MKANNLRRALARAVAGSPDETYLWHAALAACGDAEKLTAALIEENLYGIASGYSGLKSVLGGIPFKRIERLRSETAAANLLTLRRYDESTRSFARAGVRFVPMKGCDLVGSLYSDPGERPMADVDILVHPDDFDRAVTVAAGLGYKEIEYRFRLPGVWAATTMYRLSGEFSGHLDLHYSPGPEIGRRRLETKRFFNGWEPGTRLSWEQRLLVSVLHLQNHSFDSSLADLYESLLLAEKADMDAFIPLARRWDAAAAASVVFARISRLFGVVTPLNGWRKSLVGRIIYAGDGDGFTDRGLRSVVTFVLTTDRPTGAVKFGFRLLREKYRKKILFRQKKP
ncbi:MAG: nucleotidyltransferase family protein [Candidatus Coatesbacteria bacterium]|nr:MAG: nucleotidyltransferase family protein [Candidatus Coatesbacteria bacterium]